MENNKVMTVTPGILEKPIANLQLLQHIESLPMSKSNAIQIVALISVLNRREKDAKEYLEERCNDCLEYEDSKTGLTLSKYYTTRYEYDSEALQALNEKLDSLKQAAKEEQEKIKKNPEYGTISETKSPVFKLKK